MKTPHKGRSQGLSPSHRGQPTPQGSWGQAPCCSIPGRRPSGSPSCLLCSGPRQPLPPDSYPAGHCEAEGKALGSGRVPALCRGLGHKDALRRSSPSETPAQSETCAGTRGASQRRWPVSSASAMMKEPQGVGGEGCPGAGNSMCKGKCAGQFCPLGVVHGHCPVFTIDAQRVPLKSPAALVLQVGQGV